MIPFKVRPMNLLDDKIPAYKTILLLSWPTILEQVLQTMVSFVDTAMVGSLGPAATAAISVNTSTIWLVSGMMNALSIGFSVLIAKNIGAGNLSEARGMAKQCIIWSSVFGLLLVLLMGYVGRFLAIWLHASPSVVEGARLYMKWIAYSYLANFLLISCGGILRSSGDTKTPLIINLLNNIINIIMNFILIFPARKVTFLSFEFTMFGAGRGVEGAAMATGLAALISAALLSVSCFLKEFPARIDLHSSWKPALTSLRTSLKIGTPVFLERVTLSSGQIALTAIISTLGTAALAAHYVANTAESITYLPTLGFATAATTLVAQSLGAGNRELAKRFAWITTAFGVLTMTATGMLMYFIAMPLTSLFTADPEVMDIGARCLRIEAFAEPFFGLSMLVFGVLRGSGDTKGPFIISIAGMWMVRIPLAFILVNCTGMGLAGAWTAMMLDLVVRGIICFFRLRSGKWLSGFESSET